MYKLQILLFSPPYSRKIHTFIKYQICSIGPDALNISNPLVIKLAPSLACTIIDPSNVMAALQAAPKMLHNSICIILERAEHALVQHTLCSRHLVVRWSRQHVRCKVKPREREVDDGGILACDASTVHVEALEMHHEIHRCLGDGDLLGRITCGLTVRTAPFLTLCQSLFATVTCEAVFQCYLPTARDFNA